MFKLVKKSVNESLLEKDSNRYPKPIIWADTIFIYATHIFGNRYCRYIVTH